MRRRPLGPRRAAGTNPRTAGTDLRSRLLSPRALGANPRALAGRYSPAPAASAPAAMWTRRPLLPVPPGCYFDSGWRRAALRQAEIDPATGVPAEELAEGVTLPELFARHAADPAEPP